MKYIIRWKEVVTQNCSAIIEVTEKEFKNKPLQEIVETKLVDGNYKNYNSNKEVFSNKSFQIERIK